MTKVPFHYSEFSWSLLRALKITFVKIMFCPDFFNTIFIAINSSLRKQTTFRDATNGLPMKWRLRKERRNSILMTRHYPDLGGSASDWSCRVWNLLQPIRSTTQIWVVKRYQYGISALVSQTSFRISQAKLIGMYRALQDCNKKMGTSCLFSPYVPVILSVFYLVAKWSQFEQLSKIII